MAKRYIFSIVLILLLAGCAQEETVTQEAPSEEQTARGEICTLTQDGVTITLTRLGDRQRIDVTGGEEDLHAIYKETVYIWEESGRGIMVEEGLLHERDEFDIDDPRQRVDASRMDCEENDIDDAVFNPPGDMDFADMTAIISQYDELKESFDSCQVCQGLPEERKAQCLQDCQS